MAGLRILLVILGSLGGSALSHSTCNGVPPKVLYGPYFTLGFIQEFFKEVHDSYAHATGCQPRIIVSRSFEAFFQDLADQKGDLVIVAPPYISKLEKVGYRQVVSGLPVTFQLVVHKGSGIQSLHDLKGKTVTLHSELSMAAALWRYWVGKADLNSDAKAIYGGTGDTAFMRFLQSEADVAVIVNWLYDRLHPSLKNNLLVIEQRDFDRVGTIMSSSFVSSEIRQRIINTLMNSASGRWSRHSQAFEADAVIENALERYIPLKK